MATQSKPLIPAVTCDVDEEDGVGVVGVQEGVKAAGHTVLALGT